MKQTQPGEPVFSPIPKVILALACILGGLELAFTAGELQWFDIAGAENWRRNAIAGFGFWDQVFALQLETGTLFTREFIRLFSYPLIHLNYGSTIVTVVVLLCIGKFVESYFAPAAAIMIFFVSSLAGAVIYGLAQEAEMPLVGGYTGVFGLGGAYCAMLGIVLGWSHDGARRLAILPFLALGIEIAMRVVLGGPNHWIAHAAATVAGFGIAATITPQGWKRIGVQILSYMRRP